ncbi:MAG: response regulator transcription factor [Christensenellales bacterium]|jgi:two-component system response regulator YesN
MYSLMIVDSQTHCGNYPYQIPWETYGFTLTSVVKDGAEALDILRQKSIDLVITDVMPHMGGLELIQQARRLYPQVEFIIISAMAEFSYAQKALNYGVAGYCLKPIEPVELQVVLENVKNRLKRHITTVMDYFAALERFSSGSQTVDELKNFGIHWDDAYGMRVMVFSGVWQGELNERISVVPLGMDRSTLFVPQDLLEDVSARLSETKLTVGISRKVTEVTLVNDALVEAQIASYQNFLTEKNGLYHYHTVSRGELREVIDKLSVAMTKRDTAGVTAAFEQITRLFNGDHYNIRHAFYAYNIISDMLYKHGVEDESYDLANYQELTRMFSSAREMLHTLENNCLSLINYGSDLDIQSVSNDVVREILKYLHENYYQDISLGELADRYFLNSSYLCRTFKKQVGKPFTVYLANLRLRHACELLRATSMSVYEIAERCGYKDYFYFARLFKRMLGVTPTQYRAGENSSSDGNFA